MNRQALKALLISLALTALTLAGARAEPDYHGQTIVAIGDLHGDYDAYVALLRAAGLTDRKGRWTGGDTIFVQTGDVPDRGPDSLKIIEHLMKLKVQAKKKGGAVITLVGNHEAMNMTGDLRYVHPGEYAAFVDRNSKRLRDRVYEQNRARIEEFYRATDPELTDAEVKARWFEQTPLGKIEHQEAWGPDGAVGAFVDENPAVVIVGRNLLVHGGVSDAYLGYSASDMNMMTMRALEERSTDPASIINDPLGPLWYRGLVNTAPAEGEPAPAPGEADRVLAAFNVDHIIVGHTPHLQGINALDGGKVIQIDTGISAYYGGARSFLRIENGVYYANDNGSVTVISGGSDDTDSN